MNINPALPYLYLPRKTCDAIAAHIPVTYQPDVNLYTWNVADPRYTNIVNSPSQLVFTFEQSVTSNLTIKVPFALLNLTLSPPLAPVPTPYFPCQPFEGAQGMWFLGRAFLQAAYIAMNLDQNKAVLAQALGPGVATSSIQAFQSDDVTMASSSDDAYATTWAGRWKVLNSSSLPSVPISGSQASSDRLSPGGIAGICVAGVVFLLALGAAFISWRSRRHSIGIPNIFRGRGSHTKARRYPTLGNRKAIEMQGMDTKPWQQDSAQLQELRDPLVVSFVREIPVKCRIRRNAEFQSNHSTTFNHEQLHQKGSNKAHFY